MASTQSQQSQQSAVSQSSGGSYFQDPRFIADLASRLGGVADFSSANFANFLTNPTAHPLFQAQLGPLLQSLLPSEQAARRGVADQFRMGGGLNSGAFAQAGRQMEGDILGRRQQLAGNLLGQSFQQIVQALLQPLSQIPALAQALKLQQQQSTSSSSGFSSGSGSTTDPMRQMQASQPSAGSGLLGGVLDALLASQGGAGATTSGGYGGTTGLGGATGYGYTQPYDWEAESGYYFNPGQTPSSQELMDYYNWAGTPNPSISYGNWQDVNPFADVDLFE